MVANAETVHPDTVEVPVWQICVVDVIVPVLKSEGEQKTYRSSVTED